MSIHPLADVADVDGAGEANAHGRPWYHDAVVYQIYVRSFADSSGDGIGDIGGIRSRLGYLSDLGVDAIWLTPCYPSPQHDHGYDVANYFDIEPAYGNLADFDALIDDASRYGIRVMMDVVPNHCSWDHPDFVAAVAAGRGAAERARFWFRDGRGLNGDEPPNNWMAIFGGSAWTRITEPDGSPGQWYLHTFTPQQPDWNWNDPYVTEHFDRMLTFWFDRGVDGFRVDAVTPVGKHPELPDAPERTNVLRETDVAVRNPHTMFRPEGHDVWRHWRQTINAYEAAHPDRQLMTISEAYTPKRPDLMTRYANPDEFHQTFGFDLMLAPWNAPALRQAIGATVDALREVGCAPAWTLNNHDAQRIVTRNGRSNAHSVESYTGNNLINSDAPVELAVGLNRSRAAALLLLGLPGSAYLYQGEELGLPEVLDLPPEARQDPIFARTQQREIGRDGCRVPLPWSTDPATNFGFSNGTAPPRPWMPQPADWGGYAADAQAQDATSMLALYRQALAIRRRTDDLRHADLEWIDTASVGAPEVLAFRRGSVVVAVNVSSTATHWRPSGDVLLTSSTNLPDEGIPADTAAWVLTR